MTIPAGEPANDLIPTHDLDRAPLQALHRNLFSLYRAELDRQEDNRLEMQQDEDFYDGMQWSEEDQRVLRERGQAPIVYNVISQSVNWLIGTEKRGRTDFKILPRRKEVAKPAEHKTNLLKYLNDQNRTIFHRSHAFEEAVKAGVGWLEDCAQDEDDGEPLYSGAVSWRDILWDSAATQPDLADARYIFRQRWMDEDILLAMFPDRADVIRRSAETGMPYSGWGDHHDGDEPMDFAESEMSNATGLGRADATFSRRRVRAIEGWYRQPERVQVMRPANRRVGDDFRGQIFEPTDARHQEMVQQGLYGLAERPILRMRCAIMVAGGILYEGPSPYRHNRFPFTPVWGYRRGRDRLPYGLIRQLKGMQEDINKRASKALHILSTNKTLAEKGAITDLAAWIEESARPDAVLEYRRGYKVDQGVDRSLAPEHIAIMQQSIGLIQAVGGVTDELMGRTTNAVSGVAVKARQDQGNLATSSFFDNYRFAMQLQGELQLSLVEQFYSEEKQFRITNERNVPSFHTVNDGLPENDIARTKADFIIGEEDFRQTMREAQTQQLMEMAQGLPPEIVMVILDLIVDGMDVKNREEIVRRIREQTKQRDPDATEPTPEEIAAQKEAQRQAAIMDKAAQLTLEQAEADIAKTKAEAQKIMRDGVGSNVTTLNTAVDAATKILAFPPAIAAADGILHESGWDQATPPDAKLPLGQSIGAAEQAASGVMPQGQANGMPVQPAGPPRNVPLPPAIQAPPPPIAVDPNKPDPNAPPPKAE